MFKRLIKRASGNKQFIYSSSATEMVALGTLLSNQQNSNLSLPFNSYEFKIFSQFGDDGLIQYLIKKIKIENHIFIEFGVENYLESNTRFLMMKDNWRGFVMDGSELAMNHLRSQPWFWRYQLTNKAVFITKENINELLSETEFSNIGLFHIDLDGNDFHILKEINFNKLNPSILILEYNSVFGSERSISIPYRPDFQRNKAHFSNIYYGASLPALSQLASKKGYSLVGCNSAGNNAYFVRKDLVQDNLMVKSVSEAFVDSKFRESRDSEGKLNYLTKKARSQEIKGLEVLNIITGEIEKF